MGWETRVLVLACGGALASCSFDSLAFPPGSVGSDGGGTPDAPVPLADAPPGTPDAPPPPDARRPPDASPPDAAPPTGPFGPPSIVSFSGIYNEDDPSLTADMLEIFFDSDRPGGLGLGDVWHATRNRVTDSWSAPEDIPELSSTSSETTPEISPDGLTIYISSNRPGGVGGNDLYRATRASRSDTWSTPVRVAELCSTDTETSAVLAGGDLELYFTSARPGIGANDIYHAVWSPGSSTWISIATVGGIDTLDTEGDGWPTADGKTMFFSTDRAGGLGDWDIWVATRAGTSDPFSGATPVTELNSFWQDSDVWLSPDGHIIYFASNRAGTQDIYIATR